MASTASTEFTAQNQRIAAAPDSPGLYTEAVIRIQDDLANGTKVSVNVKAVGESAYTNIAKWVAATPTEGGTYILTQLRLPGMWAVEVSVETGDFGAGDSPLAYLSVRAVS